jgi:hypothetical protein
MAMMIKDSPSESFQYVLRAVQQNGIAGGIIPAVNVSVTSEGRNAHVEDALASEVVTTRNNE